MYAKDSNLIKNIHNLFILDLTNKYWEKKKTLLLVELYKEILCYKDQISKNIISPIYEINSLITTINIPVILLQDYSSFPNNLRNTIFKTDIKQLFSNPYCIYTDGSKDDKNTACAIFDAQNNYTYKEN